MEMVVVLSVTVTGKVLVTSIRSSLERLFPCRSTPVDLEFLGDRKDLCLRLGTRSYVLGVIDFVLGPDRLALAHRQSSQKRLWLLCAPGT